MASVKLPRKNVRKCPVTHQTTDQEDFEHDFTTPGKVGSLGCPFANIATNGLPDTPDSQNDPIAAEFHADRKSTTSTGAFGQCPIRFLDKHSPEEVAQYFENHKHEIPRSHQICVKRYQQNESSIRQLDAKYGSLVNMIQGLGNKHKQYLPETGEPLKQETSSTGLVEKWAQSVDPKSSPTSTSPEIEDESLRRSRFEKPLREIRVGESPSRPWGIPVPPEKEAASTASTSKNSNVQSLRSESPPAPVPIDLLPSREEVDPAVGIGNTTAAKSKSEAENKQQPPVYISFNGPVFFGYSAEQAALFLQNLNLGSAAPR